MGRKKNVSSEISKNTKMKAANEADEVKKWDSGIQKCELHLPAISLPSSSYTTITYPPLSQTCSKMQNSGLDTLPSPNTPLPSSVEVSACEPSYDMTNLPYNEKFGCTETLEVLKKLAQSEMGKKVKSEENEERRRMASCLADTCTLTDTKEYINLRDKFLMVVRTRKLPSKLIKTKFLDLINRIIDNPAAQVCYDEATRKEKPRSAWKENIESKISKLQEKLSTSETKSLKKIMQDVTDLSEALVKKNESLNVYEKKITMHESRKQFRKENRMFELFRGRFYRGLSERVESEHVVSRDEIVSFWSTMWNKNDDTIIIRPRFLYDEFVNIINWHPNWKATGIDGIYNLFIKKLTTLHKYLYDIVKVICLEGTPQADWFYCGIPQRGSDYRPITCMSNLYKLTTKCVTKVVQLEVERRGLLAENQLGAVGGVQRAKDQALLNIALNKEYGNNLKATWIDVIISKRKIEISVGLEKIMSKKIDRGILQGDSLSPLLLVLCMDPLSRKLNKINKVTVQTDAESHSTNHLLFIDDLKLLAKDSSTLSAITDEAKEFYKKSATNDTCCEDTATLLEGVSVYKYLGIIEDSRGIPARSSFEEVQSKLISRVERLCHTRLNAKKLFSAINQHAISLINYNIGVLRLEPADFSKLVDAVREVLVKNKIHLRPGCKERLYLPRTELGRGQHSVELRSEHMLLQLLDFLEKSKEISTRRAAILKVENNNKTHLALIKGFLKVKYKLAEEVTKKSLEEAQLAKLYNEIEKRKLHSKLYNARKNELVSVSDSSRWLKRGNIRPRNEAVFCYIQDRNVFWGADGVCQHCGKSGKTVDHLATRCEKMLGHDYTRRHNEV
ncbi:reverse transcriptase, partial [Hamiltosporidium tvaerminnensis]